MLVDKALVKLVASVVLINGVAWGTVWNLWPRTVLFHLIEHRDAVVACTTYLEVRDHRFESLAGHKLCCGIVSLDKAPYHLVYC